MKCPYKTVVVVILMKYEPKAALTNDQHGRNSIKPCPDHSEFSFFVLGFWQNPRKTHAKPTQILDVSTDIFDARMRVLTDSYTMRYHWR